MREEPRHQSELNTVTYICSRVRKKIQPRLRIRTTTQTQYDDGDCVLVNDLDTHDNNNNFVGQWDFSLFECYGCDLVGFGLVLFRPQ